MFIGLHRHSHYSKRDAIAKVADIVNRVGELGQTAWALTDHGTTSGLMDAYKTTQKYNKEHGTDIKFIFGCEMYWIPNIYIKDRKQSCHLLVLAKNEVGYKNLLKLTTIGYGNKGKNPDQYFYTMRVTTEDMVKCKDGLIFTSACMGGVLNPRVGETMDWDKNLAYDRAREFQSLFGDDFYLEIQSGTDESQKAYNKDILEMSAELGIPCIVTEDSHYVNKEDANTHRKWLGIEIEPDNPDAYYQTDDYYIHSEEEIRESLGYLPAETINTLVENTMAIADKCEKVDIQFGGKNFPTLDLGGLTPFEAVCKKVAAGWKAKIEGKVPEEKYPIYKKQIQHELTVLEKCGYLEYFLMTEDFLSWARSQGIRMGIGRGSVGGCLVAFLMDITRIDPIKYNLVFERFAHDKRVSLPDIDLDMPNSRRQDCIKYLEDKYGEVFHVRTFGTMKEKAAIQRAARAIGYNADEVRGISKAYSGIADVDDPELKELAEDYLGIIQNYGCHASAIMLFPSDANQWCAIEKQGEDYVAAYEYHDLEAMGLLKEDCLGIKTLDALDNCVKSVKELEGVDIDLDNLPDTDDKTFAMLCKGDVKGCFQIESGGMIKLLLDMKPQNIFDLVPLVALYRPSTIQSGMLDSFVNRRAGTEKTKYIDPALESVLGETYGVMLYQEQTMQIVQKMAGYDLGVADMFRRAIGRKIPSEMAELIPKFVKDGEALGRDPKIMQKLAEWLTNAASYQFNKSHSAAYGMTCYQTAFLKANYPVEYLCAYLNAYSDDAQEDLLPYIQDATAHGIKILPPDARAKTCGWSVEVVNGQKCIRMALNYIKGISNIPVPLTAETYKQLPKDKVENLIKAGALDFVGEREELLKELYEGGLKEKLEKQLATVEERIAKNQEIFDTSKDGTKKKSEAHRKLIKYNEQYWDLRDKIAKSCNTSCVTSDKTNRSTNELDVLSYTFVNIFDSYNVSQFQEPDKEDDCPRMVLGCVRRIKHWKQKNGKPMMFFTVECPSGKLYDLVMFNYVYTPLELNTVYKMTIQNDKFKRLL